MQKFNDAGRAVGSGPVNAQGVSAREMAIGGGLVAVAVGLLIGWKILGQNETVKPVPPSSGLTPAVLVSQPTPEQTPTAAKPIAAVVPTATPKIEIVETVANGPVKQTSGVTPVAGTTVREDTAAAASAGAERASRVRGIRRRRAATRRPVTVRAVGVGAASTRPGRFRLPGQPSQVVGPSAPKLPRERPHAEVDRGGKHFHSVYPRN